MSEFAQLSLAELGAKLGDNTVPMAERIRCLYEIRARGGAEAVEALSKGLTDASVLLRHEICYNMGQIGDHSAIPILSAILDDTKDDIMVRHEAAEALGAIGCADALPLLKRYENSENEPSAEVRETCELAIMRIEWDDEMKKHREAQAQATNNAQEISAFVSVDPAPPKDADRALSVAQLREIYLNPKLSLFERYRAMFSLRNKGTEEAVRVICEGFSDSSALFRHEVAFVLGQLQHWASVDALREVLERKNEHYMVRHEAAEALGSIADPGTLELLQNYTADQEKPVSESCVVALDMHAYWSKFNSFGQEPSDETAAAH